MTDVIGLTILLPSGVQSALYFPLLYIGPDQIMPLTSVLGAVIGVLLMFWNRVVGLFRRVWRFSARK
ncbi:MAG: hypothetical protein ACRD2N_14075 [Vicinamibacterales bacterium]